MRTLGALQGAQFPIAERERLDCGRVSRRGTRLAILCGLLAIVAGCLPEGAHAASHWVPPQQLTWYWQLTGAPKVEPVQATDMDGFDNSAATVAEFHSLGQRVICYVDVGTWENWRPDASQFPATVLGNSNGWPGERWLDVRQLTVLEPIMTNRFEMCQEKGFDAVEPDNIDGYENATGFPITAAQQLAYDTWVAQEVQSLGMAVFEKNDPDQAGQLEPYFDGVIDEQCNQYSECASYQPYLSAGKPVLNAEYQSSLYPSFCATDEAAGIMGALYASALDGSVYEPCFGPSAPLPPISTAPGGGAPGPNPSPPRIRIRSGVVIVRRGIASLRLTCPRDEPSCGGQLVLDEVAGNMLPDSGRMRAALVLGKTRFQLALAGGRTGLVSVKLRRGAVKRLAVKKSISAVATATVVDAAGVVAISRRTVTLRAGDPRREGGRPAP
jgi:hypothetical protein